MRRYGISLCVLCAVLAAACNTKKPAAGARDDEAAAPEQAIPASDEPLAALFSSGAPGMPAPVQALTFDMTRAEVHAAVPELASQGPWMAPLGLDDVHIRAGFLADVDTLRYIEVEMPAGAEAVLSRLWGQPVVAGLSAGRQGLYWHSRETRIQAVLEELPDQRVRLGVWPFLPWRSLIGDQPTQLGFETRPLLGMSANEVMAEYAHLGPRQTGERRIDLRVPGYEHHHAHVPVVLSLEDGTVTQVYIKLTYANQPSLATEIQAALRSKFGAPAQAGGAYTTWRESQPRVTMDHSAEARQLVLWFKQ